MLGDNPVGGDCQLADKREGISLATGLLNSCTRCGRRGWSTLSIRRVLLG